MNEYNVSPVDMMLYSGVLMMGANAIKQAKEEKGEPFTKEDELIIKAMVMGSSVMTTLATKLMSQV